MKAPIVTAITLVFWCLPLSAAEFVEKTLNIRFTSYVELGSQVVNGVERTPLNRYRVTTRYLLTEIGNAMAEVIGPKARIMIIEEYAANGTLTQRRFVIREPGFLDYDISSFFSITNYGQQTKSKRVISTGTGTFDSFISSAFIMASDSNTPPAYQIEVAGLQRWKGKRVLYNGHLLFIFNWRGKMSGEDYIDLIFDSVMDGKVKTIGVRIVK